MKLYQYSITIAMAIAFAVLVSAFILLGFLADPLMFMYFLGVVSGLGSATFGVYVAQLLEARRVRRYYEREAETEQIRA